MAIGVSNAGTSLCKASEVRQKECFKDLYICKRINQSGHHTEREMKCFHSLPKASIPECHRKSAINKKQKYTPTSARDRYRSIGFRPFQPDQSPKPN
jgi:hypothetical protein